jgi:hypothetical protein
MFEECSILIIVGNLNFCVFTYSLELFLDFTRFFISRKNLFNAINELYKRHNKILQSKPKLKTIPDYILDQVWRLRPVSFSLARSSFC